jgi:putative transposase
VKHFAGNYYHIFNRGIERRKIFSTEENYRFLIHRMQEYLPHYPLSIIAYCLMPNHYHILLYTEQDGGPGDFLRRLFSSYTQAFNLQNKRSGTLFEGRPKSKLIFENEYLFHVTRYIHLNPVRAGLVTRPENWNFSNYKEFIGLRKGPLFDAAFLETQFGTPLEYKEFVEAELPAEIEGRAGRYYFD